MATVAKGPDQKERSCERRKGYAFQFQRRGSALVVREGAQPLTVPLLSREAGPGILGGTGGTRVQGRVGGEKITVSGRLFAN